MNKATISTVGPTWLLVMASLCFANNSIASSSDSSFAAAMDGAPRGHWVVDPRQPGDKLPPVGRSLFDFVFTENKNGKITYNIPYPYTDLIKKIEQLVQPDHLHKSPVKQVLIPLGRSLARNIARPDFFLYPRVVSVIDTEPKINPADPGIMLKDRLYIGYGEAAEILEIISYNEAAGRFEFQIVTDYKAGGTPRVFYANREVCQACHQNGALIFSRQQWDETNSNPRIAALLKEHKKEFYGIKVDKGVDIPFAIDAATDRANLFSLYQLLWQQGCNAKNTTAINKLQSSIQCRRDLLTYALQYLLSNRSVFDNQSQYYQQQFLPALIANWKTHWPDGLLIPNPDIPNRDPLLIMANNTTVVRAASNLSDKASSTLNTMLAKNDVSDKFEPLNYRPPMDNWSVDQKGLDKTLVAGLSSFIPLTDIQQLDRKLKSDRAIKVTKTALNCVADDNTLDNISRRVKFTCETTENSNNKHLVIKGRFEFSERKWHTGKLSRLVIDGQPQFDLVLQRAKINSKGKQHTVRLHIYTSNNFGQKDTLLTARMPNGNSIDSLTISWSKEPGGNSSGELAVRNDFKIVKNAIEKLAKLTANNQSDALSEKPFRRTPIMQAILDNPEASDFNWCCLNDASLPKASLQDPDNEAVIVSQAANPETAPFYHYCSACHRTSYNQPPNFLQGDEEQVAQQISQCAERIYFRLSMWHQGTENRSKSPMPPVTALHKLGFTQLRWAASDELLSLKHAAAKLIAKKTGVQPDLEQFIKTGFDNLPECLPES